MNLIPIIGPNFYGLRASARVLLWPKRNSCGVTGDRAASGPTPGMRSSRGERGLALLAVLWLVTLLSVVAASFGATSRTETQLARNAVEKARAEALADAGVYRAILALLEPDPERQWRADGTVYPIRFGAGEVGVAIQDEAGRIDLNVAADELLHGLFLYAGLDGPGADALLDALADFRDPDDLRSPNGAEDPDYRAAGQPYGAKDGPLEAVEELQQVLGMTPELYRRIAPLVTVYSWQDGIDPVTAPPEVLLALPGIDVARVEAILAARAGASRGLDPEELLAEAGAAGLGFAAAGGTAEPERPRERSRRAEAVGDLDPAADPSLAAYQGLLTGFGGSVYGIRATARTGAGTVFVREAVVALIQLPGTPYQFYDWRRGERRPGPE